MSVHEVYLLKKSFELYFLLLYFFPTLLVIPEKLQVTSI